MSECFLNEFSISCSGANIDLRACKDEIRLGINASINSMEYVLRMEYLDPVRTNGCHGIE